MQIDRIKKLLSDIQTGDVTVEEGLDALKLIPYSDIGHTKVDTHRAIRKGFPEVIYGASKTPEQIRDIMLELKRQNQNVLATRLSEEAQELLRQSVEGLEIHKEASLAWLKVYEVDKSENTIAVLSAGTSDQKVAEEAALTAEFFGNSVDRYYDVGVAGIHRLFGELESIQKARVIIVVAGMEGALPSVVGGLVDQPVIAVPTSVGYGANFGGLSALLGMLNTCASGVTVVNIDNGFGAAYAASLINRA